MGEGDRGAVAVLSRVKFGGGWGGRRRSGGRAGSASEGVETSTSGVRGDCPGRRRAAGRAPPEVEAHLIGLARQHDPESLHGTVSAGAANYHGLLV